MKSVKSLASSGFQLYLSTKTLYKSQGFSFAIFRSLPSMRKNSILLKFSVFIRKTIIYHNYWSICVRICLEILYAVECCQVIQLCAPSDLHRVSIRRSRVDRTGSRRLEVQKPNKLCSRYQLCSCTWSQAKLLSNDTGVFECHRWSDDPVNELKNQLDLVQEKFNFKWYYIIARIPKVSNLYTNLFVANQFE